ncbi:conserved hypothetical protein [Leishmania major strain Friedlin]|uniref:Mon2 C-terminal domain-containing protein n=1 Tax=Leishmania major TaxID=5664 RepID=Q4QHX8_LEIMA|nr:conserved hypothetical protein [Leishmania major strain Friedlin]CAG9569661.1 hypothetical_protein_-__conserved [Leishmania major strain Friedlin]CAJ02525.1 conserved hypothetical protein [Leishmania major strain Friedlin]|eukprot:XP_001681220.1 conserved hypothetical protein [Leishmania major strain Friedlin]
MSRSSSGATLYAMGSGNEPPHVPVTAAEAATLLTAGAHASSAASPPYPLHYRHNAASRELLLQSIGDIGKLIALALLPVTQQVGRRVADLVRALAFQPSPTPSVQPSSLGVSLPARAALPPPTWTTSASVALSSTPQSHSAAPRDKDLSTGLLDAHCGGGAVPSAAATATVSAARPMHLVHDDPVLVRLLQMTASAASRCPLGSSALAELYGVLLLFYSGVAPQSMLEATCEATLTHHIHAVLTALHDSGAGDDGVVSASAHASDDGLVHLNSSSVTLTASRFAAQLQGVAFIKDVCRLMVGARTRWLHLSPYSTSTPAPGGAAGGEGATAVSDRSHSNKRGAAEHRRGSTPSSMAGITASVTAAAADASRQRAQEQQQLSLSMSLMSKSMLGSLAALSPGIQHELDAISAAGAAGAVSGACGLGGAAELSSLSSLAMTVPTCAAMEVVPERLRLFLMRAVTLFFKEQAKALAAPAVATAAAGGGGGTDEGASRSSAVRSAAAVSMQSPLYAQCLNDCFFSVALWGLHEMGIAVSMQPPPALFVEVQEQQQRDGPFSAPPCSLEVFMCTQQLVLVSISTHLHSMTNSTHVLLEAHERLLQRLCRRRKPCATSSSQWLGSSGEVSGGSPMSSDDAERLSQAATVVLSLWRKTLTSATLLWELLQLRSMQGGHRGDHSAAEVAAGMSVDTEAYHSSGWYSNEEWRASPAVERNGYNSDSSSIAVPSQQWSPSAHGSSACRQRPSRDYLTGSQDALDVRNDSEKDRASTPPAPGLGNAAAVGEEGGTGVDATTVPLLVRLVLSILALAVSHMQLHANNILQMSADDKSTDGKRGGGDSEEAEGAAFTGLLLQPSTPPRFLSAGDSGDDIEGEPSLKRSPRHIGPAAANGVGAAAAVPIPLCLCVANASTVYQCFTEVLNGLTAFGQLFSQLVDAQRMPSVAAADKEQVLCRCRECFLVLHPHLLHCEQLCLRHLRYEEDVLPVVLKATGYWVQVSCVLQLPEQRDAHLAALVDVLQTQDPVDGHLVALAPPTALGMSDTASPTTTMLLEALLTLNGVCAAAEPIVPGSVAAAALSPSSDRDAASPGNGGGVKGIRQYALSMSSWGAEWLRRRGLKTSSSACGSTVSPARAGGGGSGSWTVSPAQSQMNATPAGERGGVGARPSLAAPPRIGTPTPIATTSRSKQQQPAPASWAMPPVLTSHGWRSPAVQHAVILGVCRLQHKLFIMKTLHVIANALGAQLKSGWTLLARGLAVTEPLLHMLKRLLSWIEESAEEQEQQEQLLSDALHLRDALRSLCVHNACQLPYSQFEIFFAELVSAALALGAATPSQQQDGAALASNHWGYGDLHAAACAAASDRLPRHHPQGCGGQWVLTSECLSVSLLAMLPFIELRYTDATDGVATGKAGDGSSGGNQPGAQAVQLQHQRTGALARALYLWELETTVCRYVTDHQHVEEWGRTLLTTMKMHKRALLATTASSSVEAAATDPDTPLGTGSLSQEETRTIELVLFTVVGHVSTVAVQMCRSSRRRVAAVTSAGGEGGSPLNDTGNAAPSPSYQAVQSAALVLTSGPFAAVPLTQVANALFAASAASGSSLGTSGARDTFAGVGSGGRLPLLPFVQADAAQSIARLHAAVHRSSQAIALHTAADDNRSSVATAPPMTTASVHLGPLEQLLASPFALLDRVYGEWQLQYAGSPSRGGGQGGRSTAANAAEQHELEGRMSPTPLNPNDSRELPQRGERSTSSEALDASAAFSVVAGAVPQLLANAAAAVLMDVVKIVQSYGEAIDGAAWEAILSLLQRTAVAAREHDNALAGMSVGAAGGSGSHTQGSVSIDSICGRSASSTNLLGKPGIKAPTSAAGATVSSSQAVESLNTAFRALESIQHNHIPRLNADGLHRLIVCVGTFTVHRVDGGAAGERKLHTNLSAVQLLWSIADYLAAFGSGAVEEIERGGADNNANGGGSGIVNATAAGCAGAAAGGMPGSPTRCSDDAWVAQQQQHDRLWCSLLWQLRNGCLDDRQEVRQSALQTFFALVQTYGWRFSAACWRCVLQDVLLPLMEIVAVATGLCATPPPSPPEVGEDDATAVTGAAGERGAQDVTRQRLLRSFMDHPPQLEEVRVAVFNAGSRLFVTHYAHMQVAATALSSPSSARSPRPRLPIAEEDKDDATQVLERFLRLCGDVCVVLRGTSGEQAAVAAVHALHGLLVEMPGKGLHAHGVHLAWSALERLILRGDGGDDCADRPLAGLREGTAPDPDAQRRAKQRTNAVVAATVAAVCDSFRLQRLAAAVPDAAVGSVTATSPNAVERSHNATGFSSCFSGWGGGGGGIAATVAGSASCAELRHSDPSSPAPYFTRLLFLLQAVTCCPAVVNSYYFPSKAQATLLEGVAAVWPTLSSREARTIWCEVLLPAFPSAARLQSFVVQDLHESVSITVVGDAATNAAATAAASTLIPLKSVMPPGSHPGYLSAVMETMRGLMLRHMGADAVGATAARRRGPDGLPPDPASANTSAAATEAPAKTTDEDRARLAFMAPSTVQVSGTLLLLHLAPAAVLEVPPRSGSVSFNPPALFLQECVDVLQYTLWEPVLARTRTPPPSLPFPCPEASNDSPSSAAAVQCRRDGVAALCRVFELLLTTTSTVVRHLHATPPSGAAATSGTAAVPTTTITPPHVTAALQLLDLLVDTLGEVVHFVVELYEDVVCATTAITALTIASTAECTALDRVARRSLSLLQRWAGAVSGTPSARLAPPSCAATPHHHQHTRSGSDGSCIMSPSAQGTVARHDVCAQSHPAAHATASTTTSRSKLQDVVRAFMESRTKAIMAQFVGNPDDASAAALLVGTLRDMLHVAQSSARGDPRAGSDTAAHNLSTIMPDLLRLVACSSREPHRSAAAISREQEMREILANLLTLAMDEQHKQPAC